MQQVIRNITNRYGEAYAEANSDIKVRLANISALYAERLTSHDCPFARSDSTPPCRNRPIRTSRLPLEKRQSGPARSSSPLFKPMSCKLGFRIRRIRRSGKSGSPRSTPSVSRLRQMRRVASRCPPAQGGQPGNVSFADPLAISPDMRIYSSLSPLDFHARGAELCRVILLRDSDCMQKYGHRAFRARLFLCSFFDDWS